MKKTASSRLLLRRLERIRVLRGILRRHGSRSSLLAEWAEHKRQERTLEERKYRLCSGP